MSDSPTTPVTAIDKAGAEHLFRLDFGGWRRVGRRQRALAHYESMEFPGQASRVDPVEFSYWTFFESYLGPRKLPENEFIQSFEQKVIMETFIELFARFKAQHPELFPETEETSQPSGKTTSSASDSGADG